MKRTPEEWRRYTEQRRARRLAIAVEYRRQAAEEMNRRKWLGIFGRGPDPMVAAALIEAAMSFEAKP
jgi:hypothetical protein